MRNKSSVIYFLTSSLQRDVYISCSNMSRGAQTSAENLSCLWSPFSLRLASKLTGRAREWALCHLLDFIWLADKRRISGTSVSCSPLTFMAPVYFFQDILVILSSLCTGPLDLLLSRNGRFYFCPKHTLLLGLSCMRKLRLCAQPKHLLEKVEFSGDKANLFPLVCCQASVGSLESIQSRLT